MSDDEALDVWAINMQLEAQLQEADGKLINQAATIWDLRAENEKLRAALKRLYDAASELSEDVRMTRVETSNWHDELDAAAAALKETR